MIPITANRASVESITVSPSSSAPEVIGNTRELSIQAPIAIAKGASCDNSALHAPFLILLCNKTRTQWFQYCSNWLLIIPGKIKRKRKKRKLKLYFSLKTAIGSTEPNSCRIFRCFVGNQTEFRDFTWWKLFRRFGNEEAKPGGRKR